MRIIIGLGNPGEKYKKTRHNAGFIALDAFAKKLGLNWETSKKFNAEIIKQIDTVLVKPQNYMNNSGQTAQGVLSYYKLLPKKLGLIKEKNSNLADSLMIIHDDIDIPLGKYKLSVDSRSAGHNGVQSIIDYLKTKNFKRLRIGVRTNIIEKMPADKFVLQNFNQEELDTLNNLIPKIIKEIK